MSSPVPSAPRNIRILKREIVRKDVVPELPASSASQTNPEAKPGTTSEEEYEKARALIFGDEEMGSELKEVPHNPALATASVMGKAQYRGSDNSEYDPDYQRVPPTYVHDNYVAESVQRKVWDSRFPSLNQAYQPPGSFPNHRKS